MCDDEKIEVDHKVIIILTIILGLICLITTMNYVYEKQDFQLKCELEDGRYYYDKNDRKHRCFVEEYKKKVEV